MSKYTKYLHLVGYYYSGWSPLNLPISLPI